VPRGVSTKFLIGGGGMENGKVMARVNHPKAFLIFFYLNK